MGKPRGRDERERTSQSSRWRSNEMDEKAEWLNERARANERITPFGALATLTGAARAFAHNWRTLIGIEVFVVLLAFVVITPMSEALLRMLISGSGNAAVTDVDIALFFFTTK